MFTKVMTTRLVELIKERTEELFPSSRKANAAATQFTAWNEITTIINSEFPENAKTLKQVQCKWKNVRQEVKDDVQRLRGKYNYHIKSEFPLSSAGSEDGNNNNGLHLSPDHVALFLQNMLRSQNSGLHARNLLNNEDVDDDEDCNGPRAVNYNEAATSSNSTFTNNSPFITDQSHENGNDMQISYDTNNKIANNSGISSAISHFNVNNVHNADFSIGRSSVLSNNNERQHSLSNISKLNGNQKMVENGTRKESSFPIDLITSSSKNRKRKCDSASHRSLNYSDEENDDVSEMDGLELKRIRLEAEGLKRDILREKLTSAKKMASLMDNANKFLCGAINLMERFGERFCDNSENNSEDIKDQNESPMQRDEESRNGNTKEKNEILSENNGQCFI